MEEQIIKKEEYIEALDIVCKYHQQLKTDIQNAENAERVKITLFINAIKGKSTTRLLSCLTAINGSEEQTDWKGRKYMTGYDYLDELSDSNFLKIRNAGKKSLAEFKELKKRFYNGKYN